MFLKMRHVFTGVYKTNSRIINDLLDLSSIRAGYLWAFFAKYPTKEELKSEI